MAAPRRRERDDVPVELQRLLGELRQCKDRCELSLTSLATKTGFSVSSWQRYLDGRSPPPWEAVDALGRLGQAERGRLRAGVFLGGACRGGFVGRGRSGTRRPRRRPELSAPLVRRNDGAADHAAPLGVAGVVGAVARRDHAG
ncbi:helix-turn-helix domain-containing protein [Streptomyces mirabilis]|uniref:helix-turn-helix domain-containing protein n=1 Tax=Streptomyces mirabilis TaxID=68239 RepID=UPI00365EDE20